MKNTISKLTLLAFSLMLLILPGLMSCKKDKHDEPTLQEQLVGEWEVTSFKIDDLEMMDFFLSSSSLEIEASNEPKGDYGWLFVYYDGSSTDASGYYEVDESSRKLTLDNNTEAEVEYDIKLNGDELELKGIVDGSLYELTLERD